jgi:hypothetical protein
MKKWFVFVFASLLLVSLAGCATAPAITTPDASSTQAANPPATTTAQDPNGVPVEQARRFPRTNIGIGLGSWGGRGFGGVGIGLGF